MEDQGAGVQKKMFWLIFIALSLGSDFLLPFLWATVAALPLAVLSWWIVYRSGWL